jgi:hypothetical protein
MEVICTGRISTQISSKMKILNPNNAAVLFGAYLSLSRGKWVFLDFHQISLAIKFFSRAVILNRNDVGMLCDAWV